MGPYGSERFKRHLPLEAQTRFTPKINVYPSLGAVSTIVIEGVVKGGNFEVWPLFYSVLAV